MLQGKQAHTEAAESINPATGERIEQFPYAEKKKIDAVLDAAQSGFKEWRDTPVAKRADALRGMAAALRKNAPTYAEHMTKEMGKLLSESTGEIEKCAKLCDYFAEHGPAMLADEKMPVDETEAYVSYLPLGPVLGVMPWNFPFWQVMRAAVPILLGGNGFVLKHASNVMRCAFDVEEAWNASGLPKGLFAALNIPGSAVDAIIADKRIAAVTLTGSPGTGAKVASAAGKALKKSVLELGGSDPFIVLADADIDRAVEAALKARFMNCGQVCIAAKRFLLEASIAKEFTDKFVAAAKALKTGDPMDKTTTLAPMARADLRDDLDKQVKTSIGRGARLLTGGRKAEGKGFFYEPTVLADVQPGMSAFDEETFGPVAALTTVRDADEAILLANTSDYGLSGNLWTKDTARARKLARRMETGAVFINGFSASDPRTPIGGMKHSGYGRELSHFGIREFVNAQAVWVKP